MLGTACNRILLSYSGLSFWVRLIHGRGSVNFLVLLAVHKNAWTKGFKFYTLCNALCNYAWIGRLLGANNRVNPLWCASGGNFSCHYYDLIIHQTLLYPPPHNILCDADVVPVPYIFILKFFRSTRNYPGCPSLNVDILMLYVSEVDVDVFLHILILMVLLARSFYSSTLVIGICGWLMRSCTFTLIQLACWEIFMSGVLVLMNWF